MLHMKLINIVKNILALIFLCYIILSRFKRINLTKDFIETQDLLDLIFVEISLIIFLLLIIRTLFMFITKVNNNSKVTIYLSRILDDLYYIPLKKIDNNINNYIKFKFKIERIIHINKFLIYLYVNILKPSNFKKMNIYFISYFILIYIPKIITVVVFFVDIFHFEKFHYFYRVLPLLLIPLVGQYVKYICFYEHNQIIDILETKLEVHDNNTLITTSNLIPMLTIRQYLDKVSYYHINKIPNPFIGKIGLSYYYYKNRTDEQRAKNLDYNIITQRYINLLFNHERVAIILFLLNSIETKYNKYVNLIIFIGYFIGWTYIWFILKSEIYPYYNVFTEFDNPFI